MGCCEPTKTHIGNNGNMRTHNNSGTPSKNGQSSNDWVRNLRNINQRKGNTGDINQYDEILGNAYSNQFTLQMKELEQLPIAEVTDCYEQHNLTSPKAASSFNPPLINTVFLSNKGRKCYETTFPKLAA